MKIKDGFLLKEIAGQWLLVQNNNTDPEKLRVITLSSSAAMLWKELEKGVNTVDDLACAILREYEIDYKRALKDSEDFVVQMREHNMLD
jgi:hypothetical protein